MKSQHTLAGFCIAFVMLASSTLPVLASLSIDSVPMPPELAARAAREIDDEAFYPVQLGIARHFVPISIEITAQYQSMTIDRFTGPRAPDSVIMSTINLNWKNGAYIGSVFSRPFTSGADPFSTETDFYVGWAGSVKNWFDLDVSVFYAGLPTEHRKFKVQLARNSFVSGTKTIHFSQIGFEAKVSRKLFTVSAGIFSGHEVSVFAEVQFQSQVRGTTPGGGWAATIGLEDKFDLLWGLKGQASVWLSRDDGVYGLPPGTFAYGTLKVSKDLGHGFSIFLGGEVCAPIDLKLKDERGKKSVYGMAQVGVTWLFGKKP